jgi:hypothetical protein
MAARKVKVHVKTPRPLAVARPPRADLDITNITLQGKQMSARLRASITDGSIEQTIQGASTLTLVVADWYGNLLRSQLLTGAVTAVFDGMSFTLVKLSVTDQGSLSLIFEETAINLLRGYSKPRKANRANTTRAQFVRSLVREVTEATIPFSSPEINKRQPVASS